MERITDAISNAYKDERVSLPAENLGRIAAKGYSDIIDSTDDRDERILMIKYFVQQLRKDLRASAAAPGTGKRSA